MNIEFLYRFNQFFIKLLLTSWIFKLHFVKQHINLYIMLKNMVNNFKQLTIYIF